MRHEKAVSVAVVVFFLASIAAQAEEGGKTHLSVVDTFRISGSFKSGKLDLTVLGRVIGEREAFAVLSKAGSARPYNCEGSGILSRSGETLVLLPSAQQFKVHCRVAMPENAKMEFTTTPEVMWAESTVTDGDEHADDLADGSRIVTIARHVVEAPVAEPEPVVVPPAPELVPPSATAKYRITLRPGATDFRYELAVRNPNATPQPFVVPMASGETVRWPKSEPENNRYTFTVPAGDSALVVSGALPQAATHWSPPIDSGAQFLLVEAHPLLRLTVADGPRRISPRETGLTPEYRGAQAFLLSGNESIGWDTKAVEALESTSFAVPSVTHEYFLNREGDVLGDSSFEIQNTGAPDLALPMKSRPASATVDGVPMPLTRNAAGDLWTQLSIGTQNIVVQHWQSVAQIFGLAWGTLWLPQVQASVTDTSIRVHYPREWTPLVQRFRGETYWSIPGIETAPWALLLGAWTWFVCGVLILSSRRKLALSAVSVLAGILGGWAAALVVACNIIPTIGWLRMHRVGLGNFLRAGIGVFPAVATLALVVVAAAGIISLFGQDTRAIFGAATQSLSGSTNVVAHNVNGNMAMNGGYMAKNLATFGTNQDSTWTRPPAAVAVAAPAPTLDAAYRGTPAMIVPPTGATVTTFHSEMLMMGKPCGVEVVLVTTWLLHLLALMAGLLVVAVIVRERDGLAAAMVRLWSAGNTESTPARIDQPAMV